MDRNKITKQYKVHQLKLIENGQINEVIDNLRELEIDEDILNQINVIASEYEEFKREKRLGTINYEQKNTTRNIIISKLIEIINDLSSKRIKNYSRKRVISKKKTIHIISIFGSIASIIGLTYFFLPTKPETPLQLTIYVTDTNGNVVLENEGELNIPIGNRILHKTIGENGRTNFGEIASKYKDSLITIGFKAKGYELLESKNTFPFTGNPIQLKVQKDSTLGIVKGVVKNREGTDYLEGVLITIYDKKTITDNFGAFELTIPAINPGQRYLLTASKDGYKMNSDYFYPKGGQVEIRLEEIKK